MFYSFLYFAYKCIYPFSSSFELFNPLSSAVKTTNFLVSKFFHYAVFQATV